MAFNFRDIFKFCRSAFDIARYVLSSKKVDVILYYPQHFNRTVSGENPYYLPLIRVCQQNGLRVKLIEESIGSKNRCNSNSLCFDLILAIQIVIRNIYSKVTSKIDQDKIDGCFAKFFNLITFGKFKVKCIVTISNANIRFWASLNNKGYVCDLQHGIIYFGHPGYFTNDGRLHNILQCDNVKILLWGNLYKRSFESISNNSIINKKFLVVGYPMYQGIDASATDKDRVIMVSLQFTADISPEISAHLMGMLEEFSDEAVRHGYKLMLKHHPRFAGEVYLVPLMQKYSDYISLTTKPLNELTKKSMLHVTWGSTTTFEYAAYGVPTLLLYDDVFDWATNMFYGQYKYPLYQGMRARQVLDRIANKDDYAEDCRVVKQWYESAYSPLNEELLLKILKGE